MKNFTSRCLRMSTCRLNLKAQRRCHPTFVSALLFYLEKILDECSITEKMHLVSAVTSFKL